MIKYNFQIWVRDHIGYVTSETGALIASSQYIARLAITARFSLLNLTVVDIKLYPIEDVTFSLN